MKRIGTYSPEGEPVLWLYALTDHDVALLMRQQTKMGEPERVSIETFVQEFSASLIYARLDTRIAKTVIRQVLYLPDQAARSEMQPDRVYWAAVYEERARAFGHQKDGLVWSLRKWSEAIAVSPFITGWIRNIGKSGREKLREAARMYVAEVKNARD